MCELNRLVTDTSVLCRIIGYDVSTDEPTASLLRCQP